VRIGVAGLGTSVSPIGCWSAVGRSAKSAMSGMLGAAMNFSPTYCVVTAVG
jgi:hypothetical protein